MEKTIKVYFYKSIRPGLAGIYSRGVRLVTKSIYSHCEIQFSDGWSASSSYSDGGVRYKKIDYDPNHWDCIELPAAVFEAKARQWFDAHEGQPYDLLGNLHFVISVVGDSNGDWFCSEAVGAALGLPNSWRFDPGSLYQVIKFLAESFNRREMMNLPTTNWASI
jgi:hypothetical protein